MLEGMAKHPAQPQHYLQGAGSGRSLVLLPELPSKRQLRELSAVGRNEDGRKLKKEPQHAVGTSPALFMFPTHQTSYACGSSLGWCCQKPLHAAGCTQGRWW